MHILIFYNRRYIQSVYIEFVSSRQMEGILDFLVHAWQQLGLPEKAQFDNGREFCGFGHAARSLSRVIRLCLRLGVEPVFIPEGKPQRNGFQYIRATIYTQRQTLKVYHQGRLVKQFAYKLVKS